MTDEIKMIDINELRLIVAAFRSAGQPMTIQASQMKELLDRIEAAEKERDALRAKIEAMEKQKPVGEIQRANSTGNYICSEVWVPLPVGSKLYALPGAQNVPTSLLVAIADLVTQMEIVARVGFVDAPDDKDSCAAFCVAEGTWLELMSAVESLASALAAVTEAKP